MAKRYVMLEIEVPEYHADDIDAIYESVQIAIDFPNTDYQLLDMHLHEPTNNSEIATTRQWFIVAGQMQLPPILNVKQVAFYLGMQCEELGEKLMALYGPTPLGDLLEEAGNDFKTGSAEDLMHFASKLKDPAVRKELLDADADLMWVTIGAAYAQGADFVEAYRAVSDANWAKFPGGVVTRDEKTGKVLKPAGWQPADLTPFIGEA